MSPNFALPPIPPGEISPLVEALLGIIRGQAEQLVKQAEHIQRAKEQIQALSDEIAILKGLKPKPKIPKSKLEDPSAGGGKGKNGGDGKRAGSAKKSKTDELKIHETIALSPDVIADDWVFKGYNDFVVQGLVIEPHNIKYRRGRWITPDGETIMAPLPAEVYSHFSATLISYIQHQYFACRVTQPLLLDQLREIGIDISSGQLNEILTEDNEEFHLEKSELLQTGLSVSSYAQTDDTGARHEGKNGYTTCISNDLFTFFASSNSKSRINFLEILRAGHSDYVLNTDALIYMRQQNLSQGAIGVLEHSNEQHFIDAAAWHSHLADLGITAPRHVRIATEGTLLASAIFHGLSPDIVILSDDAGQFNILIHALCWIHAERLVNKLVGFSDEQRADVAKVRDEIWALYQQLKLYKTTPSPEIRATVEAAFDAIFTQKTCFETLNQLLMRLNNNKAELLRVLDHPDIPLHNNGCETDVREAVTKRKVSGGTQSDLGRRARDTFLSLKRTCRKLGVSFWKYLNDRNAAVKNIPRLSQLIIERAAIA